MRATQQWVNVVASPNYYRVYDALHKTSAVLREHAAIAYLAYNLVTSGKQLPSLFLHMTEVGPERLIESAAVFMSNPKYWIDKMHGLSPQMKHRQIP